MNDNNVSQIYINYDMHSKGGPKEAQQWIVNKNYYLEYKTVASCFSNYTTFRPVTTSAVFK